MVLKSGYLHKMNGESFWVLMPGSGIPLVPVFVQEGVEAFRQFYYVTMAEWSNQVWFDLTFKAAFYVTFLPVTNPMLAAAFFRSACLLVINLLIWWPS